MERGRTRDWMVVTGLRKTAVNRVEPAGWCAAPKHAAQTPDHPDSEQHDVQNEER